MWLATWLVPAGLLASGLWPDLRVAGLHVLFIGGFGLLAFSVATHVTLGHLDLADRATGRPASVVALGVGLLAALAARIGADVGSSYFGHLGWATGIWIVTTAIWLGAGFSWVTSATARNLESNRGTPT